MNAKTIKSQIKKAGFNLDEWQVEKAYKCYNILLTTYGLGDTERQTMTGDEVNDRRAADNGKIREMAQLFDVLPGRSSVTIPTDTETYRYGLSLPNQSRGYGPCEVCGNHVDQTYYQVEEKRYYNPIRKKFSWTHHKCRSYFGHRNCLISKQR